MIAAVNKAKIEINDQPDELIESVDRGTANPGNVAGITEIEHMRHRLIECQPGISNICTCLQNNLDCIDYPK